MVNFVPAGKTSEFEDGTMKKVSAQGHEILIASVGDLSTLEDETAVQEIIRSCQEIKKTRKEAK
ncbi:hypothetical protein ACFLUO_05330 [Chloroflexota bacterium]